MATPNQINHPQTTFNSNDFNQAPEPVVRRFVMPLPPEVPASLAGEADGPTPAVVRRSFDDDVETVAEPQPPVPFRPITGTTSMVRAVLTAISHEIGVWRTGGAATVIAGREPSVTDPTEAELDQMWDDLQLFSQLPPALQVTRETFEQLARPSLRAAYLQAQLTPPSTIPATEPDVELITKMLPSSPFTPVTIAQARDVCSDALVRLLGR